MFASRAHQEQGKNGKAFNALAIPKILNIFLYK
jgi:hypothetical protein